MSKFQAGDEVEFVNHSHFKYIKGYVTTVSHVDLVGFYDTKGIYSLDERVKLAEGKEKVVEGKEKVVMKEWDADEDLFIKVNCDEGLMEIAQSMLFGCGCRWLTGDQDFRYYNKDYLHVYPNGSFRTASSTQGSDNILDLTPLKPVKKVEVSIDGFDYTVGVDTAEAIKNIIKED